MIVRLHSIFFHYHIYQHILFVKTELNGMVNNVLVFLALQVILIAVDAAAVKLQSMHVLLVLIGMVTDVFMSQTSVQPV